MSITQRIKLLIDQEYNQSAFAEKVGLTKANVSKMINKGGQIRSDTLEAILKAYPDLNGRWLITGQGPMWLDESKNRINVADMSNGDEDEMIKVLKQQVRTLEVLIRKTNPDMARQLGLTDEDE